MFCEVYHRIHPTFFYLLFLITAHKRKQIIAEKIIIFFGIIQRLFVVKIVVRIHRLIDDAIHFNRPVFRTFIGMIQPDALSTVIANLIRIKVTHVALSALYAISII